MSGKESAIGIITARHHESHGFFGGYLIINALGRPLEFHCTMPLQPTRAQSILYGQTLDEFVCGEQIALALVKKARTSVDFVLTDSKSVLALRRVHITAVICAELDYDLEHASEVTRPNRITSPIESNQLENNKVYTLGTAKNDFHQFQQWWTDNQIGFDIAEPFERVSQALLEAHPATKAA